jgi:hypothetical protein
MIVSHFFVGLTAAISYNFYGGDAIDAYMHSPPPCVPTYVCNDDAYCKWYLKCFGKKLDRWMVLAVLPALQGHPIYVPTLKDIPVLLSCQGNDFLPACPNAELGCICNSLLKRIFLLNLMVLLLLNSIVLIFFKLTIIPRYCALLTFISFWLMVRIPHLLTRAIVAPVPNNLFLHLPLPSSMSLPLPPNTPKSMRNFKLLSVSCIASSSPNWLCSHHPLPSFLLLPLRSITSA